MLLPLYEQFPHKVGTKAYLQRLLGYWKGFQNITCEEKLNELKMVERQLQ